MQSVDLNALEMVAQIALIIGVPFVLGIWTARKFPEIAAKAQPWVKNGSLVALLIFIVAGVSGNASYFVDYIGVVLLAVFLHDSVALALGYFCGAVTGLNEYSRRAVSFEVGIRNAGLGLGLVFTFFDGLGGMAVVAAGGGSGTSSPGWLWPRSGPSDAPERRYRHDRRTRNGRERVPGYRCHRRTDRTGRLRRLCRPHGQGNAGRSRPPRSSGRLRPAELGRVFGEYRPNVVIHLASIVNPGKNTTAEQEYRVDVDGTRNVLAACVEHGVGRIVVSSSGAAYGYYSDNPPWITEDVPVRGNDEFTYSRHKRLVEEMLAEYRVEYPELEQVVFRIGTILGEASTIRSPRCSIAASCSR
ncbi:hypothetical protein GCM10020255_084400 [Rhodococcus baikonurensis]